jgi:peptidoglycan/LPS O-acetylase OafA/YrhL
MRPLLWIGACSYSTYLIHVVVTQFPSVLCRRMGLDGHLYWIAFWIEFMVAIACGRLFYHLVERHFLSTRQKQRLAEERVV